MQAQSDLFRLGLTSARVQYFLLVARLGSIRKAAGAANVAPSSISRAIRQLEEDLGSPLFDRLQRRLKLTTAGELLFYRIKQSTGEMTRAVREIHDLHGLRRGTVSLAVIESVARGVLPDVLDAFWQRYRDITVDAKVVGSPEAAALLEDGSVDLAVAFDGRVPRGAQRVHTAFFGLGVLVAPESPLAGRAMLRPYDLSSERVILSDNTLSLGASMEEIFSGRFMEFSRRMQSNSIGVMVDLARRGLGTIVQTRVGVEGEIARGELVFIPLSDARLHKRRLMLLSRSRAQMSEAATALATAFARRLETLAD